jgi:hypothetical protein
MSLDHLPRLTLSQPYDRVQPGDTITFDDGRVAEVVSVEGNEWVYRYLRWHERAWRIIKSMFRSALGKEVDG